ncbi:hypothetical protein JX265_013176 [Neoarthrinium moseri]|uniref:Uncharacterized protein n=1 Tax=Neoarthrinium moseri TaxID=1658444 RepID=A0A9P9W9D2_9PEZI|nr:uncharacterized protein JN550_007757 [Neoarthrinium moseri]KAI1841217.1 hypothetical protein JX266_012606 [Neoarthrinium moseri]KAI1851819.1 hypothetical protein JX265_013176 [Neoarthrinium moseri]KAI1866369.1 hypothetical protein JN550_007757 [Neoarthrinium moseri]
MNPNQPGRNYRNDALANPKGKNPYMSSRMGYYHNGHWYAPEECHIPWCTTPAIPFYEFCRLHKCEWEGCQSLKYRYDTPREGICRYRFCIQHNCRFNGEPVVAYSGPDRGPWQCVDAVRRSDRKFCGVHDHCIVNFPVQCTRHILRIGDVYREYCPAHDPTPRPAGSGAP